MALPCQGIETPVAFTAAPYTPPGRWRYFTDLQPQTWKNADSQNNKIIRGSDHPATRNFLNQPLKRSLAPIVGPKYQEGRKLKSNQWSQCLAHLTCGEVSGGVLLPRIAHHPRNFRGCSAYGLFLALAWWNGIWRLVPTKRWASE